jgi:hypothetical protein
LFSGRQQPFPQGDERDRIAKARQAAEALFAAKPPPVEERPVSDNPESGQAARKPRVLAIVPPAPAHHEPPVPPAGRTRRTTRVIPRSQYARIRTWVEYGMTASEVAEVYGTAVREIERILGTS